MDISLAIALQICNDCLATCCRWFCLEGWVLTTSFDCDEQSMVRRWIPDLKSSTLNGLFIYCFHLKPGGFQRLCGIGLKRARYPTLLHRLARRPPRDLCVETCCSPNKLQGADGSCNTSQYQYRAYQFSKCEIYHGLASKFRQIFQVLPKN